MDMAGNGRPRKKRILRRIVALLIVLLIVAGALFYAYNALKLEYTVTYDSYTAATGSISNALSFSGNLALVDSATYTAGSNSTVRTLYVSAGDDVKKDDKLVRLANGETVSAGFDGRVNTVSVAKDDDVSQGAALVQIADFTHLKVAFRVDEYDIGDVSVGQRCTVTVTALERAFESEIDAIDYISASSGNVAYYTATAYVDVDDGVLPGMQVTVTIPQEEAVDVVVLKVDALSFDFTNRAFVWMKNAEDALEEVYVTTGVSNGNYIEIKDGVKEGDVVYAEAKTQSAADMWRSMFGTQQFNQPTGMNSASRGNMGERSGFGGERPSGTGSGTGGSSGGSRSGSGGGGR